MTFLRRFLVLAALMFWQGGFVFYTAVVVPVGTEVLGSPLNQAAVTRRVTVWLNGTGAVALWPLLWDAAVVRPTRRGRLVAWVLMAAAQVGLFVLHPRLDAMFDHESMLVLDRSFRFWHRVYLWLSTGQWVAGVVFAALTLAAWRGEDRDNASPKRR